MNSKNLNRVTIKGKNGKPFSVEVSKKSEQTIPASPV